VKEKPDVHINDDHHFLRYIDPIKPILEQPKPQQPILQQPILQQPTPPIPIPPKKVIYSLFKTANW